MSAGDSTREAGPAASGSGPEASEGAGASGARRFWEQYGTLLLAVVVALTIRAFVIEPFRIPSGSMLPTLLVGDHLFVNKFVYGVRLPFGDDRLPALRDPERGDVVVFQVARRGQQIFPADERPDLPREDFVKRVVGLPGDVVEVRSGRVFVNGERVPRVDTGERFPDLQGGGDLHVQTEILDGCAHHVLDDPMHRGLERSPLVVPEGRYFMLGDNRDRSNDSRAWGTVRLEEMKGPAFILYWSWDVNGSFLQFLNPVNWFTAEKRWDRIFRPVRCDPAPGTAAAD